MRSGKLRRRLGGVRSFFIKNKPEVPRKNVHGDLRKNIRAVHPNRKKRTRAVEANIHSENMIEDMLSRRMGTQHGMNEAQIRVREALRREARVNKALRDQLEEFRRNGFDRLVVNAVGKLVGVKNLGHGEGDINIEELLAEPFKLR